MIATYMLFVILLILFFMALMMTKDYLSPSCLVCESFIVAYLSAIFSSQAGGWRFSLNVETVIIIVLGLMFYLLGSFGGNLGKNRNVEVQTARNEIKMLSYNSKLIIIMLIVQCVLLLIYVYYFKKSNNQFYGLDWNSMMRMRRFIASYGDGLEIGIPGIVNQSIKLAKVNAYIALYYLMHNVAVHSVNKKEKLRGIKKLILIILLYFPYSILQSARFEIFTLLIAGIIIWYIFYRFYSNILYVRRKNMIKAFRRITIVICTLFILVSILGTIVGRAKSDTIFSEGYNYMGRTMQAFNNYIQEKVPFTTGEIRGEESFYGLFKLLNQLGFIDTWNETWYLEFISQDGQSLGNTYTTLRRYYSDFGYLGIIILPFIEGFIMSKLYNFAKNPKYKELNLGLLIYSMVIFSAFFYAYEGFFFSNVISFNYFIVFILIFIISKITAGHIKFLKGSKIRIRQRKVID